MQTSAQENNQTILITDVGSLLGFTLAETLLAKGNIVFGCGKTHPPEEVLQHANFTLIDIDLAQPWPEHLPDFDLVVYLCPETIESSLNLSTTTRNILSLCADGKSKVAICLPITSSVDFMDFYAQNKESKSFLKVFLVGDIYGPKMRLEDNKNPSYFASNKLTNIISQAVLKDKIILPNEGSEMIYPTYVDDACHQIDKFLNNVDSKKVRFVISQHPLTALSASYEIQNAANIVLQKELGIFFSGVQSLQKPQTQPVVKVADPGYSSKFDLAAGSRNTMEAFKDTDSVKRPKQEAAPAKINPPPDLSPTVTHLRFKKPKLNLSLKAKTFLAFLVLLVLLIIGKMSLDVYLGSQNIKDAKSSLHSGDFQIALEKSDRANAHFESAKSEFGLVSFPFRYILPQKVKSANDALESAAQASGAVGNFSQGAKILSANIALIVSTDNKNEASSLEEARASFAKAHAQASYAQTLAISAQKGNIYKNRLQKAAEDLKQLTQISQISFDLANLLPNLTGTDTKKSYLLLIVNNSELRPGGGFIGSYAKVDFLNGKLTEVAVDDIYNIDGQLKEKIDPPIQLTQKLGVKQLYLRDSNWTTDFGINAKTARDFYKKETGNDVDGVIAFDLTFMQKLLAKIGPIKLENYNEQITAENLFEKGEYYAEIGFFPGSTQKKDFFATLAKNLIDKITSSLIGSKSQGSVAPLLALVDVSKDGLLHKNLLMSFDDKTASSFVKAKGWDNPLPPANYEVSDDSTQTRDFLALSEANIGANKVNRYLERSIDYEMTIGRDADLMAKLTLTYKNNSPNNSWPAGTYVNYLRVYTPQSSGIEDFQENGQSDLEKVEVASQANLSVFATLVEVPVGQTKTLIFKYRIPKNIKLEKAPVYSIYFQKQPGTEKDPLKFTFHLPVYLKIDSVNTQKDSSLKQTYTQDTDLQEDRQFTIAVIKK